MKTGGMAMNKSVYSGTTTIYVTDSGRCHDPMCGHLTRSNDEETKQVRFRAFPTQCYTSPALYQRGDNTSNLCLSNFCTACRDDFRSKRVKTAIDDGYLSPDGEPWECSTGPQTVCDLCGEIAGDWHQVQAEVDICDWCLHALVAEHRITVSSAADRRELESPGLDPVRIVVKR